MRASQSLAASTSPAQPVRAPTIGSDLRVLGGLYLDVLRMLRYRLVHGRQWQARLAGQLASAARGAGASESARSSDEEGDDEATERDHWHR